MTESTARGSTAGATAARTGIGSISIPSKTAGPCVRNSISRGSGAGAAVAAAGASALAVSISINRAERLVGSEKPGGITSRANTSSHSA